MTMAMEWQPEMTTSQPLSDQLEFIDPQPGHPHTLTIIFLHGRGDTAANFKHGLAQTSTWTDSHGRRPMDLLPSCRWVFPTAGHKPCAASSSSSSSWFTPPSMSQWFDVWDHLNLTAREMLQQPGLRDSAERVRGLVAAEAGRLGGRWDRIVLVGISQGGATGVHTLLNLVVPEMVGGEGDARTRRTRRLGAFVGVACRLPFPGRALAETRGVLGLQGVEEGDDEVVRCTPVMLQHCADDPTVKFEGGKQLRDALEGFGAEVTWKEYPDGGHWFKSPKGLEDMVEFLDRVVTKD